MHPCRHAALYTHILAVAALSHPVYAHARDEQLRAVRKGITVVFALLHTCVHVWKRSARLQHLRRAATLDRL